MKKQPRAEVIRTGYGGTLVKAEYRKVSNHHWRLSKWAFSFKNSSLNWRHISNSRRINPIPEGYDLPLEVFSTLKTDRALFDELEGLLENDVEGQALWSDMALEA